MNTAARVVSDTRKFDRGLKTILHNEFHRLDVPERTENKLGVMVYRCLHGRAPRWLADPPCRRCLYYDLANLNRLTVPHCLLSTYGCRAFHHAGPTVWNSLPDEHKHSDFLDRFKRFRKTILFSHYSVTSVLKVIF